MTNTVLKALIDSSITDETSSNSVSTFDVGTRIKDVVDYVDQEISALPSTTKTSGTITLSATFQVLPYDINSCSFASGKAFLPTTTENGKEVLVIAVANNIEVRANESGTNFMFETFNTFISSVTLTTNQMYRFTYIGFGGYWKAELL